jgi:hypothetical protein
MDLLKPHRVFNRTEGGLFKCDTNFTRSERDPFGEGPRVSLRFRQTMKTLTLGSRQGHGHGFRYRIHKRFIYVYIQTKDIFPHGKHCESIHSANQLN